MVFIRFLMAERIGRGWRKEKSPMELCDRDSDDSGPVMLDFCQRGGAGDVSSPGRLLLATA